jgi:hypothetical protein
MCTVDGNNPAPLYGPCSCTLVLPVLLLAGSAGENHKDLNGHNPAPPIRQSTLKPGVEGGLDLSCVVVPPPRKWCRIVSIDRLNVHVFEHIWILTETQEGVEAHM